MAGHDDHGHDSHGHDSHGHDSHSHGGHGHEQTWGDYNAKPLKPSSLPPLGGGALLVFGLCLAAMLGAIALFSLKLSHAQPHHGHDDEGHPPAAHPH